MSALLAALEATELALVMQRSRWFYAGANTAHVLGIALLVGGIIPLDLRLLGLWRSEPLGTLAAVLTKTAALGLFLAVGSGFLLFMAKPVDYAGLALFQAKLGLIALGFSSAICVHVFAGPRLAKGSPQILRVAGVLSLAAWVGALVTGRMIAFVT